MGRNDHRSESSSHKRKHSDRKEKKEKKDRKERKEKKDKKHSHHHKRRKTDDKQLDEAKALLEKMGSKLLTTEDYFNKNSEFRLWLFEKKGKYFDEMSQSRTKKYFKKFVKAWNTGSLADKYYKGISETDLSSTQRTRYKWGFTAKSEYNADDMERMKDEIARATKGPAIIDVPKRPQAQPKEHSISNREKSPPADLGMIRPRSSASSRPPLDEDMDDEDRRRYERLMTKKVEKGYIAKRNADLEELAPKPDPGSFAARREKRAMKGGGKREDSPDHDPNMDVMGDDDSVKSRLRRQAAAQRERAEKKADEAKIKLAEYQRKEDEKMAYFREMLANRNAQGNNFTPSSSSSGHFL